MAYYFEGFSSPNSTYVPDVVFDELAPQLTEAELRVLLYIIRRTFGFKKNADTISLRQMTTGIRTKEGKVLDNGTGLSKSANARGVKGLIEKGIILATRNRSKTKGDEATTYTLHFKDTPVSSKETRGVSLKEHGGVLLEDPQHTVKQNTVRQQTDFKSSNIRMAKLIEKRSERPLDVPTAQKRGTSQFEPIEAILKRPDSQDNLGHTQPEIRDAIAAYITEFAHEFNDQAPMKSSTTRAVNLFHRSGLALPTFISRLFEARALTRESVATIRQRAVGHKTKMAYYFACLEDRLHLRADVQKSHFSMSPERSRAVTSQQVPSD